MKNLEGTPSRRRLIMRLRPLVVAAAVVVRPLDRLAELIGKPINLGAAICDRYNDHLAQAMRPITMAAMRARSSRLADSVTRNNAALMKIKTAKGGEGASK